MLFFNFDNSLTPKSTSEYYLYIDRGELQDGNVTKYKKTTKKQNKLEGAEESSVTREEFKRNNGTDG